MPKKKEIISDEILLDKKMLDLHDGVLLTPSQVSMLTGIGEDELKALRAADSSEPPAPLRSEKGTSVWYPLGEVRAVLQQRFRRFIDVGQTTPSFAAFTARATEGDTWPIVTTESGQPSDFFALRSADASSVPKRDIRWLTLKAFAEETIAWAQTLVPQMDARAHDDALRSAPEMCPRCGKPVHSGRCVRF